MNNQEYDWYNNMNDKFEEENKEYEENLEVRFYKFNEEYLHFENIPKEDRLHPNNRIYSYMKIYSLMVV